MPATSAEGAGASVGSACPVAGRRRRRWLASDRSSAPAAADTVTANAAVCPWSSARRPASAEPTA